MTEGNNLFRPTEVGAHAHAGHTHCIRAIAGEVLKSRSVHLINFSGGGQVIASKSATALILDRCGAWRKNLTSHENY